MMVWRRTKNELFVAVSSILASKAKKRQVSQKNIFVIKCFSVEAKKNSNIEREWKNVNQIFQKDPKKKKKSLPKKFYEKIRKCIVAKLKKKPRNKIET